MNKKGLFYTVAAVSLTLVIIITYTTFSNFKLNEEMDVIQTRIESVNFFIKDVENDLEKGAFIAGFRTLLSLNQYISTNGTFLTDANANFVESFLNGTINNEPLTLMTDSTFTDWANRISTEAQEIDIRFNFTINDLIINQSDPWTVDIELDLSLEIYDFKNTSAWVRNRNLVTSISIIDFEDPLYTVNSLGRVTNPVTVSNITQFVVNKDVTNLLIHTNRSAYIANEMAPSYLMRLEGNLGNSTYGIESLVNLQDFIDQSIPLLDRSVVDHVYFGGQNTTHHRINNTPGWFRIDDEHLETYQVVNETI